MTGRALAKYRELSAERGALGYPVTDERSMKNGVQQTFEHGFIATSAAGDARVLMISGATFTDTAVVFSNPGIRLDTPAITPDMLVVTDPQLPQPTTVTCGCASRDVMGTCKVKITNKGKNASCSGACNCMFEVMEETFK